MGDCNDKPKLCNDPLWRAVKRLPGVRQAKRPAETVTELYERYPDGVERGSFAWVCSEDSFYTYHVDGEYRGQWRPLCDSTSNPNPTVNFDLSPTYLSVLHNDTSAKIIAVTAPDDSWAANVSEGWATVAKTSGGTAAVTLIPNMATTQRSQNITFLWTDPNYGQLYTRTLTVVQGAKVDEPEGTNNLYLEGTIVARSNNLPLAGVSVKIEAITASSSTTLSTIISSGVDTKYRYTWPITESEYGKFISLRVTCSKSGYATETKTAQLPSYSSALSSGIALPGFALAEIIEEPYSKILIRTEFYKVVADEVEFSVSPQSIEFNFDELTTKEIAVIAANNTWTVAAGDSSWCTVAKTADNKATITLTENTGTANRSQLVTFTWTSPTTNVTTQRTVAVTQYYEAIVANPVVFSGQVIDAETGEPVVISGNAGCRMYSFPPNSIGGGARMFNIETDTSGNFTQTVNYDRVAWDNIGRFRAMFEVGDLLYVEQQVFEVTAPVYEDAMADGVSFGTLQLQRIPTAKIIIRTEFYNVEEETPAEPVYIFGVVKDYNTGAVIPAATVDLLSDSTPIATVTADAQGRFYYEWDVDENTYNNMYGLYYTVRKAGYQDYPSVVYFSLLPDYADSSEANGGVNLGTIKMQKS